MSGFDVTYPELPGGLNAPDGKPGEFNSTTDPTGALERLSKEEDNARLLTTLTAWWHEARDSHAANRYEQHIDADFYDHQQWDQETKLAVEARGQAALTYNLVKPACDWVIGTERRTRVDWKVHPRGPEDLKVAQAKGVALKYVDDVNNGSFARSQAFEQAVKVGVGWMEECVNMAGDEEPITFRNEDWKCMWWDPFARHLALFDARYIIRAKWLDVDYAITLFPQHRDAIERCARAADDVDFEDAEDPADVPGMYFFREGNTFDQQLRGGTTTSGQRRLRHRVRILETWYRKPVRTKRMASLFEEFNRKPYDAQNADHVKALQQGVVTLYDGVTDEVHMALWVPGKILERKKSPYRHNRYPFTPIFAYRADKTGMPYGLIRGMRDAQDDYNKRRAKALFLLSVNRLIYEEGVVEEEDEQDFLDEAAAPDAQLRVRDGALRDKRIQFETGQDLAQSQMALMEQDRVHIFEGNGVTRENLGQESNAISGRAILAKQQQGAVTTAGLFDNYRFAFRVSGQKQLSLVEQFMSLPKRLRIVGPRGTAEWLNLNEPNIDPATGEVIFNNDIAASEADFYVDQQDYRETVRMAMAESMFETIKGLADPNLQLQLLDLAVEMTDIPNRDEFVRRIRSLNGQSGPGEEESPEQQAARAAQAQQQQRAGELELAERESVVRKNNATALKTEADARKSNVDAKVAAMDGAAVIAAAIPLAPTADRLAEFPQPQVNA